MLAIQIPTAGSLQILGAVIIGTLDEDGIFVPYTGGGGGGAPSGPAGGDLSGTYPDPGVAKINGVAVSGVPTSGQIIVAGSGVLAVWVTPTAATVGLGNVSNVDNTNADNLTSGTLPNGRFPTTLPAVIGSQLTGITADQVGAATAGQGAKADTALQPGGNGSGLTGITPAQVGAATAAQGATADSALQPNGNGSGLSGITAAQVGALTPSGDISGTSGVSSATVAAAVAAVKADGAVLAAIIAAAGIPPGATGLPTSAQGGIVIG